MMLISLFKFKFQIRNSNLNFRLNVINTNGAWATKTIMYYNKRHVQNLGNLSKALVK